MSESNIVVWGIGTPRTLRVHWALHEVGQTYATKIIRTRSADMDTPEFLAASPGKKIPAFSDDGFVLTESGAIVNYIFDKFGKTDYSHQQRAEINRWSFFTLMEIDATALYVIRRHQGLPEIYGDSPVAVKTAEEYFARQIALIEDVFADGRKFITGTEFSAADIMLGTCCDWAAFIQLPLPDRVEAHHQRLRERPKYQAAFKANTAQ